MRLDSEGMFVGIEREGKYAGSRVLFIQGYVPWPNIEKEARARDIRHLEFGSGRFLFWDDNALDQAFESDIIDRITVETDCIQSVPHRYWYHPKFHAFITLLMPEAIGRKLLPTAADPELIEVYNKNANVEIKVATGVNILVMNINGLSSYHNVNIFALDEKV